LRHSREQLTDFVGGLFAAAGIAAQANLCEKKIRLLATQDSAQHNRVSDSCFGIFTSWHIVGCVTFTTITGKAYLGASGLRAPA
jgi:hypothetical protein